uniref:Pentatricopeptide repeat-containing protein At4g39530 family n=1 Tax=Cajanus cajan TaxID=3821 RepID=A0A151QWV7_CAJCA|nr:Pentatricopeptide repeat-containing protein At4g39530 family [Cajanus cajan]
MLIFDGLEVKTTVTWTAIITGYSKHERSEVALKLFNRMKEDDVCPDRYVISSVLSACSMLEFLEGGRQIHGYVLRRGFDMDVSVVNGIIDFYLKCHKVKTGRKLFDQLVAKDVVSWTTMIAGCMQNSFHVDAMDLFDEMVRMGWKPDAFGCTSVLNSCGALQALEKGRQVHAYAIKVNIDNDDFVKNDNFAGNIVVWNAMFSGYSQQLENEESLKLYKDLQISKLKPNEFTFAAVISAASNIASLRHGQQFHNQVIKMGLDDDPFVINALVDMYAKCGSIEEALKAFSSTDQRDIACWNSMISTYAQHGEAAKALEVFKHMIMEGVKPNYVTFVGVLSACSHAGLLDLGFNHFESMSRFGIEPGIDHYACMVSLLGRAGKIYEAKEFIEKMPIKPAAVVWRSLLSACRASGHVELGTYAAEMAISCDPADSGSYILLSNIFASKGMWENVRKLRKKMETSRVVKEPGWSWIEVNREVHRFIARDTTHRDSSLISLVLDNLILQIKGFGYVPEVAAFLLDD